MRRRLKGKRTAAALDLAALLEEEARRAARCLFSLSSRRLDFQCHSLPRISLCYTPVSSVSFSSPTTASLRSGARLFFFRNFNERSSSKFVGFFNNAPAWELDNAQAPRFAITRGTAPLYTRAFAVALLFFFHKCVHWELGFTIMRI